jgi:hypothetical protein
MTRKDVKGVIETLAEIGHKELKKTGAFFVPGFAGDWVARRGSGFDGTQSTFVHPGIGGDRLRLGPKRDD